jgi:hypothetical protein
MSIASIREDLIANAHVAVSSHDDFSFKITAFPAKLGDLATEYTIAPTNRRLLTNTA